jgi:hypothetical protein
MIATILVGSITMTGPALRWMRRIIRGFVSQISDQAIF